MAPVHLILGATGGIGFALCHRLAAAGAGLALAARDGDRLNALAGDLGRGSTHALDATDPEQVERVVAEALEQHGRLDGMVCCVGSILLAPAHRTTPAAWRETVAQNLDTAFWTVRWGAAAMRAGGGSIVLVSSAAARIGLSNQEAIAAAKAGVIGLTLGLRRHLRARGPARERGRPRPRAHAAGRAAHARPRRRARLDRHARPRPPGRARRGGARDRLAARPRAELGHRPGPGHRRRPELATPDLSRIRGGVHQT
jgi:NAD(P)-dependent dehydrogenase (short-subunit alcohol dehydrogenase family)